MPPGIAFIEKFALGLTEFSRKLGAFGCLNGKINLMEIELQNPSHPAEPPPVAEPAPSVEGLIASVVRSVSNAQAVAEPFYHLEFNHAFPDGFYARMLEAMPTSTGYRAMSGRSKHGDLPDGTPTRIKIDLFPEFIRHMAPEKRDVWAMVGRALCSDELRLAFVERLAPDLERRFGRNFRNVRLYPIPILTRDVAGYRIRPHTDTVWKGITVQFYLPPDDSIAHVGTVFHEFLPDGSRGMKKRIPFAPNTGYAFAVGDETWHSVAPVKPDVKARDSILLTYFVDSGAFKFLRNRSRRLANFALNELRNRRRPGSS